MTPERVEAVDAIDRPDAEEAGLGIFPPDVFPDAFGLGRPLVDDALGIPAIHNIKSKSLLKTKI